MKQDYVMRIYKADKRTKSGQRIVSTTVWRDRTADDMKREQSELTNLYPVEQGYRFEIDPAKMTVKNLMTGQDVEIASDTPWCCNPASESYWSN